MKASRRWAIVVLILPLLVLGCADNAAAPRDKTPDKEKDKEARIKASLAKLDTADRESAEEQKYCAVEMDNRLGSMGKPVKVTMKDQAIWLCCKGCEKAALKDPDKTLARVEELKIQAALEQLDPADRRLAQEQKFCAGDPESRLGSMGAPAKILIENQPVFLCCKGCEKSARRIPKRPWPWSRSSSPPMPRPPRRPTARHTNNQRVERKKINHGLHGSHG